MIRIHVFLLIIFAANILTACAQVEPVQRVENTSTLRPTEIGQVNDPILICKPVSEIPVSECMSLVALYFQTSGDHWIMNNEEWANKDFWLETSTPCSWAGIRCENGHVTEISLGLNGLPGEVPSQIGDLTYLTTHDLTDNHLTKVPPEIGSLTNLSRLNLAFNDLSGLPIGLGNLTHLTSLYLAGIGLESFLPIGNLTSLTEL
jgi:Leucine-rich repeat (LRR) protein